MKIESYKTLQNGSWISTKDYIEVINPTNLKPFALVPAMTKEDIDNSLQGSRKAFKKWSMISWKERIAYLEKFAKLMEKNKEQLTNMVVQETAKSSSDALLEVERSISYIRDTNMEYEKLMQNPLSFDEKQTKVAGKHGKFVRVPHGVVLAISPFNYPINLAITKIAPALVAGNSVLFKPASQGVVCGILLSKMIFETGIHPGVFNLVTGKGRDIGDYTVSHKEIDMINFTGSTSVGNKILELAPKKVIVLELGGKDAAIVLDDVTNFSVVANEIVKGAFSYSGQRCTAIKRVFVNEKIAKKLEDEIAGIVKKLTIGNPEKNNFITPMIDLKSVEFASNLIFDAIKKGAKILTGNIIKNNLMHPTVLSEVTKDMDIAWKEQFAPILPIIRVKNDQEAIDLTNQSEFGLQASIFTNNIKKAEEIANQLDVGSININKASSRGPDIFPFIGVKSSGFGVQGLLEAILSVTRYKGIIYNK